MTGKTIFIQGFAGFSAPLLPGFLPLEESALKQTRERFSLRRADRFTTLAVMAAAFTFPSAVMARTISSGMVSLPFLCARRLRPRARGSAWAWPLR